MLGEPTNCGVGTGKCCTKILCFLIENLILHVYAGLFFAIVYAKEGKSTVTPTYTPTLVGTVVPTKVPQKFFFGSQRH